MKKQATLLLLLLSFLCSAAQRIKIIAPKQVVAGNAFQIQYVISDPSDFISITPPRFENLRLISGPNYYRGRSVSKGALQQIENITYTLMALNTGPVKINAVTASFKNNENEKTEDVVINVVPQPRASFNTSSTYTDINLYAPASKTDLDQLISENLFIKTEVDKTICFLGEAITATFKLYSRLQSTSEVINAPSLYGFSVMDVLNINEAHQAVETINGKVFNTSVLRKLQLYPAQTGKLVIDEMQLQNEIEFRDSISGRKIKVRKLLASKPVAVTVRPLPDKQPVNYSGAVGKFTIGAAFQNQKSTVNTQGKLMVTISGKGNFIQFGEPVIDWSKDFNAFDPLVSDELDKNKVPAEGSRTYTFPFAADRTGSFTLPPVSFSYFDPATHSYEITSTDSLKLEIIPGPATKKASGKEEASRSYTKWWMVVLIAFAFLLFAFLLFKKRKKQLPPPAPVTKPDYVQKLREATSSARNAKEICAQIQKLLREISKGHHLSTSQKQIAESIQNDCQLLAYSDVDVKEEKIRELQARMESLLQQLQDDHSAYL